MQLTGFDANGTDGSNLLLMDILVEVGGQSNRLHIADLDAPTRSALQTAVNTQTGAALKSAVESLLAPLFPAETDLSAASASRVAAALTAADGRIATIAADRAALTAATTLAQVKPIVDRQLQAESVLLTDLEILIKALRWLV
jgi:hypothetical protein